jgi:hypothetical protein
MTRDVQVEIAAIQKTYASPLARLQAYAALATQLHAAHVRRTKADAVPVPAAADMVLSAADMAQGRAQAVMAKTPGLTFGQALSQVYREDPALYQQVQDEWRQKAARQDQPR